MTSAPAGADLTGVHLLLLPPGVTPAEVHALVLSRVPDAVDAEPGLRLGRDARLHGPLPLDDQARAAGVPAGWVFAYALAARPEREEPAPPGLTDRQGWYRAFPAGLPTRGERRALDLMAAVARRLGGAVRVAGPGAAGPGAAGPGAAGPRHPDAGTGALLRPDPASAVDVVVHSPYWLEPETVLAVVQGVDPAARLAVEVPRWPGPPPGLVEAPPDPASAALRPDLRVALHAAASRLDAAVLAEQTILDSYAVVCDLGPRGRDGLVEVRVHVAEEVPPALAVVQWASSVVSYEVRWSCPDPAQADSDRPTGSHRVARVGAHRLVAPIAVALVEATDGLAVDADGFLVDRYDLEVI